MRKYDLTINSNSYEVIVKKVTETEALVEVNGQEHSVSINQIESLILPESIPQPPPKHVADSRQTPSAAPSAISSDAGVIAPMPGQIKSIFVREGDKVKAGDTAIIISAMKMESEFKVKRDGLVKKINVKEGDIVEGGKKLIVIK